jgi:hypothetical protein
MDVSFAHTSQKDGSWRPCGDYRHLNLVTTPDKYPLPNMQELANGLHGCTMKKKIDLVKGYHQIPVTVEDIPKTANITLIWLVGIFVHSFLAIQCRADVSTHDGPHNGQFGGSVCLYGRLSGQLSR